MNDANVGVRAWEVPKIDCNFRGSSIFIKNIIFVKIGTIILPLLPEADQPWAENYTRVFDNY